MKLQKHGKNILDVEVLNISNHGIWMYAEGVEYFLSYKDFPWFQKATVEQICHVQLLHEHHLFWPDLDVDLELESLKVPEYYPLVYK